MRLPTPLASVARKKNGPGSHTYLGRSLPRPQSNFQYPLHPFSSVATDDARLDVELAGGLGHRDAVVAVAHVVAVRALHQFHRGQGHALLAGGGDADPAVARV